MSDRGENVYMGTPIVWADAARIVAGTATDLMTLLSLAAAAGQVGAQHDLGARHRVERYKWRLTVQFDVNPTAVGEIIEIYVATAEDGAAAAIDGGVGQVDAAVTVDEVRNCLQIGSLATPSLVLDHDMSTSGIVRLPSRYVSPIVWNAASQALRDEANHEFTLTPIFKEAGPV